MNLQIDDNVNQDERMKMLDEEVVFNVDDIDEEELLEFMRAWDAV
jgi:sulfur relay (sulfurtransferase) DsrF/TusC family protein